jgi:hypothetical protein
VEIAGHSRLTAKAVELSHEHPRLRLLYGAVYSPHDNPAERIWAALKAHLANTAVTWTERIHQARVFFRRRTPEQMLATAAPWTSPWLPRSCALDMDAAPLPPSKTGFRSAILYRRATVGRWVRASFDLAQETTHGFVVVAFTIADLPTPLTIAAGHLDPTVGTRPYMRRSCSPPAPTGMGRSP